MTKNYKQGNLQAINWWFCFKWDHIGVERDPIAVDCELKDNKGEQVHVKYGAKDSKWENCPQILKTRIKGTNFAMVVSIKYLHNDLLLFTWWICKLEMERQ